MSWHFLQGQEEASWEDSSLAGAPSALLKSMLIVDASCSPVNVTECSNDSPYGTTYVRSTVDHGAVTSTSSVADSHVRISVQPEAAERASEERKADFGWKWPGSFAKYNHDMSSWKTRQCLLVEDSDAFSETWPRWGIMRDGECSELSMLALRTSAIGFGLLPTLTTSDKIYKELSTNVRRFLCRDSPEINVIAIVATAYQNLTTIGNKGCISMQKYAAHQHMKILLEQMQSSEPGGPLIPLREWMMGWPIGWTALGPLEMAKFQEWQRWHGER